jgi:hypothetical protein
MAGGQPCGHDTCGLLGGRDVTPCGPIRHIGKEAHQLEDREAGRALDPDEFLMAYTRSCLSGWLPA